MMSVIGVKALLAASGVVAAVGYCWLHLTLTNNQFRQQLALTNPPRLPNESLLRVESHHPERQRNYWESSSLPLWMKEYFDWHVNQTQSIDQNNWKDNKQYLILRCTKQDKCGGLSDRLKSVPVFIAAAARSRRIFMIRWERPARLEEFLMPNEINWTVPTFILEQIKNKNISTVKKKGGRQLSNSLKHQSQAMIMEGNIQDFHGGAAIYHEIAEGKIPDDILSHGSALAAYDLIFHDLWKTLFVPSPPVAQLVDEKMKSANLTPGKYISGHHRALYGLNRKQRLGRAPTNDTIRQSAINMANCASSLQPGLPIYFASDSQVSIDVVRKYGEDKNHSIITFDQTKEMLHLDKTEDWESRNASEFYSSFVDLLVMGNSLCLAYGDGGYGQFAALLNYNSSCTRRVRQKDKTFCEWHNLS